MNIAVIGIGYVGLVTGVCLSEIGNNVTCIDIDEEKVKTLRSGKSPIYEEGLEELLQTNIQRERLHFTSNYEEGLAAKEVIFLAVGTPQGADGSADLTFLNTVCSDIVKYLHNDVVIVTKSTVPIGTNEHIKTSIEQNAITNLTVKVVSNPEFLRQGTAVHDTFNGDRIVIGCEDEEAMDIMEEIYKPYNIPIVKTDLRSAEMIKYASNTFLATKISFINEIANLCEHVGANVDDVANGIGMDGRIGGRFLKAGIGYGGSCFPKDTNAIIALGNRVDYPMFILESVQYVNEKQTDILVDKIIKRFSGNIEDITIALLGLAFKANTDDMRGAPSVQVAHRIIDAGAKINAYDPVAVENAKSVLPKEVNYVKTIEEVLNHANCAVILTDWKEIKEYPISLFRQYLSYPIVFDGRNCFSLEKFNGSGIEYHSVGRPSINRQN
ncbi:UDP-glucose dehydrogenase family protein [Virgibacillus salinus]|uniref:UDP-glucose 6-dehydrogenase n=1 Tax=Virgibacillus salinus TaxID=553311 RepID=A0A1H0YGC1_9BACI|nr:UDP-glucose/GDP-mannose dehydrogenase family protein [Virgibacillus salinus]SDQ14192.1 UDPglucose 6-dehydrogenase [Virgibacillus salinus]